jgi:hypothetical protein
VRLWQSRKTAQNQYRKGRLLRGPVGSRTAVSWEERFALDNMQVNKNRTKRKQYLVCHESTKKSPGMEKSKKQEYLWQCWTKVGMNQEKEREKTLPLSQNQVSFFL